MLRLENEIIAELASLDPALAVLMTHGSADLICAEREARETFDRLPLREKRYVLVEEMMHDPFFRTETHRDEVFAAVEEWLDQLGFPKGC